MTKSRFVQICLNDGLHCVLPCHDQTLGDRKSEEITISFFLVYHLQLYMTP